MIYPIVKDENGICTELCPHGKKVSKDVPTFGGDTIRVGSHLCLCCEWNANYGHTPKGGNVYCIYQELRSHRSMMKEFTKDNDFIDRHTNSLSRFIIGKTPIVRIGMPGRNAILLSTDDMDFEDDMDVYIEKMKENYGFTFNRTNALIIAALINPINQLILEGKTGTPLQGCYYIQDTHGLSTDWMLEVVLTPEYTNVANVVPYNPEREIKCRQLLDYSCME